MKGVRVKKREWGNGDILNFASDQPKTISQPVAGIWFVWFLRSVSIV